MYTLFYAHISTFVFLNKVALEGNYVIECDDVSSNKLISIINMVIFYLYLDTNVDDTHFADATLAVQNLPASPDVQNLVSLERSLRVVKSKKSAFDTSAMSLINTTTEICDVCVWN